MLATLAYILRHPLNRGAGLAALVRFARWQAISRISGEVQVDWVDGARLALRRHMVGATGNLYCGLHEYVDMAFVLAMLRPGDLFLDIGANVGSYTILASKVCGARTVAFEPGEAVVHLRRNVEVNGIANLVDIHEAAVSDRTGPGSFTAGLDAMNRLSDTGSRTVSMVALDSLDLAPTVVKLDIEGGEEGAFLGGQRTLLGALAIITETTTPRICAMLSEAGFRRRFYSPRTRTLQDHEAVASLNALFVRDETVVADRLARAPGRSVFGRTI